MDQLQRRHQNYLSLNTEKPTRNQRTYNEEDNHTQKQLNREKATPQYPTYSEVAGTQKTTMSERLDENNTYQQRSDPRKQQNHNTKRLPDPRQHNANDVYLTPTQVYQDLLTKQLEKMDMLFAQMSLLMGLIVSLVEKL